MLSKALVLAIIVLFIGMSVSIFIMFSGTEEQVEETIEEIEEISLSSDPTNQTLFITIHRIRKKGIIDQMFESGCKAYENFLDIDDYKVTSATDRWVQNMKSALEGLRLGYGWDEKPQFSFILKIDDYEWNAEQEFNDWDTGYMDRTVFRDVSEGKEFSDVTLEITENKYNAFGKIIGENTVEVLNVQYDFKTGRWCGDDSFNDSDGYGHYNGSSYEIWISLSQTSADGDLIPFWVEKNVLHTSTIIDDSIQDPDLDGIPTDWEWKWGYDPFTWDNHTFLDPDNDGIQNIEEYKLAEWLANPFYPEIYIECDWMEQTPRFDLSLESPDGWTHEFYPESQQMIIERFNEHSITVHIDDGCMGGGGDIIPFDKGGEGYPMGDFGQEKGIAASIYDAYFEKDRKGIFRYLAICYKGGWCHPQDDRHCYDCIFVPMGRKGYLSMSAFSLTERTKRIAQAVSILHEVGHSCGFNPEIHHMYHTVFSWNRIRLFNFPDTDLSVEEWEGFDYVSCMSYEYYFFSYFDYSDGTHGEYDNDDWGKIDLAFFQKPSPFVEGLGSE